MLAELHLPISGAGDDLAAKLQTVARLRNRGADSWDLKLALQHYAMELIEALAKIHRFGVALSGHEEGLTLTVDDEGGITVEGADEDIERLMEVEVLCPPGPCDGGSALRLHAPSDN